MELVHNCLRVQGGIIVPVYNVEPEAMKRLSGSQHSYFREELRARGAH